jgi:4-amino-4-deoxy-L-arabinose transferase-like glycosyltransferase
MNRWMLLALFGTYLLVALAASQDQFRGDEGAYVGYATNLVQGFYTYRDPERMNLWYGPGYPLLLAPFVAVGAPWLAAKVLNALLLLGGVLLFYQTLRIYVPARTASWGALLVGLYPPFFRHLHQVLTETLAVFLVCAFAYLFCRVYRDDRQRRWFVVGAAAALAWLALTKVVFGYVIVVMLLLCLLGLPLRPALFKRAALVFGLAMVLCTPYLLYTWSVTGRAFYWGNSGGPGLYWLATPYEGELGDWQNWSRLPDSSRFRRNHRAFFASLDGMSEIERSDSLQRQAVRNIKAHPKKFLRNWTANVGRLFFSFPFTDRPQKLSTLFYALPNTILLSLFGVSVYALVVGHRLVPVELNVLPLTGLVALGGISLVGAEARYFTPLVPLFALWIVTVLGCVMEIRMRRRHAEASGVGV